MRVRSLIPFAVTLGLATPAWVASAALTRRVDGGPALFPRAAAVVGER